MIMPNPQGDHAMSQHTPGQVCGWCQRQMIPGIAMSAQFGRVETLECPLHAAAPELLAALERICRAQERCAGDNPLDAVIDDARTAIAKAKGE